MYIDMLYYKVNKLSSLQGNSLKNATAKAFFAAPAKATGVYKSYVHAYTFVVIATVVVWVATTWYGRQTR